MRMKNRSGFWGIKTKILLLPLLGILAIIWLHLLGIIITSKIDKILSDI